MSPVTTSGDQLQFDQRIDLNSSALPPLIKSDIHVFAASLDGRKADEFAPLLSPDECERADRLVFKQDRERFIVARGLLRRLLSRYFPTEPARLTFELTAKGKPFLAGQSAVNFNLAHSHNYALFAVCSGGQVGVDIEYVGREVEYEDIAERFFSVQELGSLRKLPAEIRKEAFFDCWTRKEAYIKALGGGLSIPLSEFTVSLGPGAPAALLSSKQGPHECSRWRMFAINVAPGYKAALVCERECSEPRVFHLR